MRLSILLLLVACSEARREPQITIGQLRELDGGAPGAISQADFAAVLKMHAAQDKLGLAEALLEKRAYSLEAGTRVRLLDYDDVGPSRVRVESGKHVGLAVWIPTDAYLQGRRH